MPWLVVLGTGSWSDPGLSPTTYRAAICKKTGRGYPVSQEIADAALKTGYWWLQVFPDENEPILDTSDPSGVLGLEDIRSGVEGGVRLQVLDGGGEVVEEEWVDPEAPDMIHGCQWCSRKFPSSAALDRHVEFEHTKRHIESVSASIEAYRRRQQAKDELRRLQDHDGDLPPWEKEAAEHGIHPDLAE